MRARRTLFKFYGVNQNNEELERTNYREKGNMEIYRIGYQRSSWKWPMCLVFIAALMEANGNCDWIDQTAITPIVEHIRELEK